MQLKNNLYSILGFEADGVGAATYSIELNDACFIYKAHFPGQPITPGVCIVQMVKELLEDFLHKTLTIASVKNVKFLSVLSPTDTTKVKVTLAKIQSSPDGNGIKAQAVVATDDETKTKVSLTCSEC